MKQKLVWTLTLFIILITLVVLLLVPGKTLSDYGAMFSACGGFLAVIWFYHGLSLQRTQLKEQREQFQLEFDNLKSESKRQALLFARDVLADTERRVSDKLKGIGSIEELPILFSKSLIYLKDISESNNPKIVSDASKEMLKVVGPASILLRGLRDAGMCVLESDGFIMKYKDAFLSGRPEYYLLANYNALIKYPFIAEYATSLYMLATLMTGFNLDIIVHSGLAAMALDSNVNINPDGIEKMKKFKEENPTLRMVIVDEFLKNLEDKKDK